MISREDKADVARKMGKKTANKVAKATNDGFDYKGMMKDLAKSGFGGVRTSGNKGKSISEIANSKNTAKNKAIHAKTDGKKLNVQHSDKRHMFYRTLKDKSDYSRSHIKSMSVGPYMSESSKKYKDVLFPKKNK